MINKDFTDNQTIKNNELNQKKIFFIHKIMELIKKNNLNYNFISNKEQNEFLKKNIMIQNINMIKTKNI